MTFHLLFILSCGAVLIAQLSNRPVFVIILLHVMATVTIVWHSYSSIELARTDGAIALNEVVAESFEEMVRGASLEESKLGPILLPGVTLEREKINELVVSAREQTIGKSQAVEEFREMLWYLDEISIPDYDGALAIVVLMRVIFLNVAMLFVGWIAVLTRSRIKWKN